jgi:phosphatidylglycerophosphate synthase
MSIHDPQTAGPGENAGSGPGPTFVLLSVMFAVFVGIASMGLAGEAMVLPVAGFACGAGIAGVALMRGWGAARFGPANTLTLGRMALASLFIAPLARPDMMTTGTAWIFLALAMLALALDGLDGRLARRSGLAGPWGARFDMEVDAVFALLLAAVAWRTGVAGGWILLLGGMRYLFVLAMWVLPWLRAPLPERMRRKAVCVIQVGTLAVLLAPIIVPPVSTFAAVFALGLLAWSFATDIVWLARKA